MTKNERRQGVTTLKISLLGTISPAEANEKNERAYKTLSSKKLK